MEDRKKIKADWESPTCLMIKNAQATKLQSYNLPSSQEIVRQNLEDANAIYVRTLNFLQRVEKGADQLQYEAEMSINEDDITEET